MTINEDLVSQRYEGRELRTEVGNLCGWSLPCPRSPSCFLPCAGLCCLVQGRGDRLTGQSPGKAGTASHGEDASIAWPAPGRQAGGPQSHLAGTISSASDVGGCASLVFSLHTVTVSGTRPTGTQGFTGDSCGFFTGIAALTPEQAGKGVRGEECVLSACFPSPS